VSRAPWSRRLGARCWVVRIVAALGTLVFLAVDAARRDRHVSLWMPEADG
jgi:hypothetical protein